MKLILDPVLVTEIHSRKILFQVNLLKWGHDNFRPFPWRTNMSPYSILVAEILLKRTTASAVSTVFNGFMKLYPNPQALSKANPVDLENILSRIGYHKKRSKNLIEIASVITQKFNGEVPNTKNELLEIPFIGDYTANAILTFGNDIATAIVDSNVIRIISKLFSKRLPNKSSIKTIQSDCRRTCPSRK